MYSKYATLRQSPLIYLLTELVITLQKNAVISEAIGDAMVCINFDKAYATEFEVNALSTANLTTPASMCAMTLHEM